MKSFISISSLGTNLKCSIKYLYEYEDSTRMTGDADTTMLLYRCNTIPTVLIDPLHGEHHKEDDLS